MSTARLAKPSAKFSIPMRGNEEIDQMLAVKPFGTFSIPMRGNEHFRRLHLLDGGFQVFDPHEG